MRSLLSCLLRCAAFTAVFTHSAAAEDVPEATRHLMSELTPVARIHLAKTADWVAITDAAVWVGTTGPDGVAKIDPRSTTRWPR